MERIQIENKQEPSLLDSVGNTPLLPLRRIGAHLPESVRLYAKAEWLNPAGSVKDRPATYIIRQALEQGELTDGRHLLDSTSGNMGIAYATYAAHLGIPVTLAITANASRERLSILRALGADLRLSDPLEGFDGAIHLAREIEEAEPQTYHYANQYANEANWRAHYETTGPEIWNQSQGQISHFVVGLGTSGTLMGVGAFLKEQSPNMHITAFQPDGPIHGIEGLKHMASSIVPAIYDPELADDNRTISSEEAYAMTRRLSREEGLFVGVSSGASAAMALQVAERLDEGVVVTLFPDAGYKYLSEPFWGIEQ